MAAIETLGKDERCYQHLTLEQECAFLQPFLVRAAQAESAKAIEIKLAFEAQIGHEVNKSTLYRFLSLHGSK